MLLAGNRDRAHAFLDRLVEIHLANLERYLEAVGPYIDIIVFGDDLGMQNGPQMSPAMYREFFQPRHARLWRRAKELAAVKVMLHCCGGVRPILADLIDAGLDAINPVQISCAGMERPAAEGRFRRAVDLLGRRLRHATSSSRKPRRTPSGGTSASKSRSSAPAADSSSSRSTTSWPTCRRKTSSPCSTPLAAAERRPVFLSLRERTSRNAGADSKVSRACRRPSVGRRRGREPTPNLVARIPLAPRDDQQKRRRGSSLSRSERNTS